MGSRFDNVSDEPTLLREEERLPWLESVDDDAVDENAIDRRRLAIIGAIGVLILAVLLGGVWFLTHRLSGGEPPADGSVIAAPEEPYKTRPDNPGGKEFAGTGDLSYAVGEGQAPEGRLAATPPEERTGPSLPTTLDAPDTPEASAPAPEATKRAPAAAAGTLVQVGAYARRDMAEEGWRTLMRQTTLLNGVSHRVVEGQADIGRVFRLQAVTGSRDSARTLCASLKAEGLACQVK